MGTSRVPTTKLTRELYVAHGFDVDLCHRTIPGTRIAKDLFGVFDMIAVGGDGRVHYVQYTDWSDISKRMTKVSLARAAHRIAFVESNVVAVIAWRKLVTETGYEGKAARMMSSGVWTAAIDAERFVDG